MITQNVTTKMLLDVLIVWQSNSMDSEYNIRNKTDVGL